MHHDAIEFHDSKLRAISWVGRDALLEMRVYVHRSDGGPGRDGGEGWFQDAEVLIAEAAVRAELAGGVLWVIDGFAEAAGERFDNLLPLPCDLAGDVELSLTGAEGTFRATGRGLRVTLKGEQGPVERFKPLTEAQRLAATAALGSVPRQLCGPARMA